MGLKQRIINGIGWNVGGSIITQAFGFITKIILARILFPEDFGLFAMVIIVIQFLNLFVGSGLSSAVIYKKEDPHKTLSTAFILALSTGFILSLISFLSGSHVAKFFNEPALNPMIKLISIVLIFDSISTILYAGLVKELHFKRKAVVDVVAIIIYSTSVLVLALLGYGAWSLIIAYIIQHTIQAIVLWIISPIKPNIYFDKEIAKEIGHFGKYSVATLIFSWAITSIDNILVGKKLGDEGLGYYSFGFNIATLPVLSITHMITGVFHPVFAKVRDNKEKLQEAYLKPLEWSLIFILPMSAGLFILAEPLVKVIFGERWLSMIPILKIFSLYSIFRTVCTIIAQLLEGVGKPKTAGKIVGIELLIIVILIVPSITYYGILGVAWIIIIARIISMCLYLLEIKKVVSVTYKDYTEILGKKIVATIIMGVCVYSLKLLLKTTLLDLFIITVSGMILYGLLILWLEKRIYKEFYNFLNYNT